MPKYLTKSRFKLALDCPTKLYYTGKKAYQNLSLEDSFLAALAEGGFQVGELAKAYFPEGHDITTLNKSEAVSQTNELLKRDQVVIFEAALMTDKFFIRVDILKKVGNSIQLIEVKAKSIDQNIEDQFWDKRELKKGFNKLSTKWKPYLYDIAFQKAVTSILLPNYNITSCLMLVDKTAEATVDGLNQMFAIQKDSDGRTSAIRTSNLDLGEKILSEVNVDHEVSHIIAGTDQGQFNRSELGQASFAENMDEWSALYEQDVKAKVEIGSKCKNCEFKSKDLNLKSGFHECWNISEDTKTVLDIWNFRKSQELINAGVTLLSDINEDDINPSKPSQTGLTQSERQLLQIEKYKSKDNSPFIDSLGLDGEMSSWVYPLNFIDFETSMVALPFNKGRRPYEQIAFQFSHHTLDSNGTVEHVGDYINTTPGVFPNFDFVRNLKRSLEINKGSIFRYSNHENTVLIQIMDQLKSSNESDKEELIEWIMTITHKKEKTKFLWSGERNMIDLWDLVKKFYYHPRTNGSNSIKAVLPAVLFESNFLKEKYAEPIYGKHIKSLNFKDWAWLKLDSKGEIIDPYKQLEPLEKSNIENHVFGAEIIKDGGAAATGYAAMQFVQMSEQERKSITEALLKYCELDTLAMVMIVEHWNESLAAIKKAA